MVHDNVYFHNCAELVETGGHDGLLVQRVPERVRTALNPGAQARVRNPDCVEIRFVTSGERVSVTLSAEGPVKMLPFWGDFPAMEAVPIETKPTPIELTYPERLSGLPNNAAGSSRFDRSVWRLQFTGRSGNVYYHGVDGKDLAPPPSELCPTETLLTYGTSITHGSAATLTHLSYAYQTARLLGKDLINLGVGGSCHAEKEFADYIAEMPEWDTAVLALSVNMIGAGFTKEQFAERVGYMVDRVAGSRTDRHVFCVTVYPHVRDLVPGYTMPNDQVAPDDFRSILADTVNAYSGSNVTLVPGPDVLSDPAGLTADLVHPSDYGMTLMARNLADRISAELRAGSSE